MPLEDDAGSDGDNINGTVTSLRSVKEVTWMAPKDDDTCKKKGDRDGDRQRRQSRKFHLEMGNGFARLVDKTWLLCVNYFAFDYTIQLRKVSVSRVRVAGVGAMEDMDYIFLWSNQLATNT